MLNDWMNGRYAPQLPDGLYAAVNETGMYDE